LLQRAGKSLEHQFYDSRRPNLPLLTSPYKGEVSRYPFVLTYPSDSIFSQLVRTLTLHDPRIEVAFLGGEIGDASIPSDTIPRKFYLA